MPYWKWILFSALAALSPNALCAQTPEWPAQIHARMQQVARISWELRQVAQNLCPTESSTIGIGVDTLTNYAPQYRDEMQAATNLDSSAMILFVAPDGPAALADVRPGDKIVEIDGLKPSQIMIDKETRGSAESVQRYIAKQDTSHVFHLVIVRNDRQFTKDLPAATACSTQFFLKLDKSIDAHSDGHDVAVSTGLLNFTQSDDEVALVLAHELAHALFRDIEATGLKGRRIMESRADIVGAAIAQCAGYSISSGLEYWTRFQKSDILGFLRSPSHASPKKRIAYIQASEEMISCPLTPDTIANMSAFAAVHH